MKKKTAISAKIKLERLLIKLGNFPWLLNLADEAFNIPRLIDRAYLKQFFKKGRYQKALDIGSGKGSMTRFLLSQANEIVCLDSNKKELEILKRRFENKLSQLLITTADARKLPFENNTFDLIFCNCVLEHIKKDKEVLAQIARCLRPNGTLIMTFPNKEMTPGWFKSLLFSHPSLRFLADPSLKKYFSFKNLKEAEEWYALYRWQHVRRGYSFNEIKKRLAKYNLKVKRYFYYPDNLITEAWEIATFSKLNTLFPYILPLLSPIFYLLPKRLGGRKISLEFAILAKKEVSYD